MEVRMKAAIYYGPGNLKVEEIERPKAGDRGIVVKVRAAGSAVLTCTPTSRPWERYKTGHRPRTRVGAGM